ncbi:MAG: sialate O-acetylesterase [Oscillospiraceae bacterium]|nr:sialate O-acetylesterase [Oscillospiraceae bacterium]
MVETPSKAVSDFRIFQRNAQGYAEVEFSGVLPADKPGGADVYARVLLEDDNSVVLPWKQCERDGRAWRLASALREGGLYRFEACALVPDRPITMIEWTPRVGIARHVGVGEVFMLAGQSNMAGYGRDAAYDPAELGVHLYANDGMWKIASHPLNDSCGSIYPETLEESSGTSPALAFGRTMRRRLGVPIGLAQASKGATSLSEWNPAEDGALFRSALKRWLTAGPASGVLWYQGCSDAHGERAATYLERFTAMVAAWRAAMGDIPFMTVQLNRWTGVGAQGDASDKGWGQVREAQRQAARTIPGVYVVPAMDLAMSDMIHNSSGSNVILGERMARAMLGAMRGAPEYAPDVIGAEYADERTVLLRFRPEDDVIAHEGFADGFDVEDERGLAACVKAETVADGLRLTVERDYTMPARVNGMWRRTPPPALPRGRYGVPMLGFYGVEVDARGERRPR